MPDRVDHSIESTAARNRPLLGMLCRLGAVVSLALMFALVKIAGNAGVHVVENLFWRQFTGLPVALLWLWWSGDLPSIATKRPFAHALRMILGLTGMAFNFTAMLMLPMAEATTFGFATPIFATLLAAVLLAEPTGRYRWGAVVVGFIGVLVALRPGHDSYAPTGVAIALSGALCTAAVSIQMRRMAATEGSGAIVFWFSLTSLVPLGVGMAFFGQMHDSGTWLVVAGLSIMGAIGQILLTASLRFGSVATVMTMDYSALLFSVLLGWLIFGDLPGHNIWAGAVLIVGAGATIAWREHRLARLRNTAKQPLS